MVEPVTSGSGHQPGVDGDDSPKPDSSSGENAPQSDEPPKKRRRTAKPNADKKFECTWEGCGKSYSRAEHLYRHRLNHTPKALYWCDFPGCTRHFVRQDLCVRHRERHTTHGSQLHRRDAMTRNNSSPQHTALMSPPVTAGENRLNLSPPLDSEPASYNSHYTQPDSTLDPPTSNPSSTAQHNFPPAIRPRDHASSHFVPPTPRSGTMKAATMHQRNISLDDTPLSPDQQQSTDTWSQHRESSTQIISKGPSGTFYSQSVPQSPVRTYSNSSVSTPFPQPFRSNSDVYVHQARDSNNLPSVDMLSLGYSTQPRHSTMAQHSADSYLSHIPHSMTSAPSETYTYSNLQAGPTSVDMTNSYGYPLLGGDEYGRSPFMIGEDFNAWLFNQSVVEQTDFSPSIVSGVQSDHSNVQMHDQSTVQSPSMNYAHQNHISVHSGILDTSVQSNYNMSESKRQELLQLMSTQFIERPHDAVKQRKHRVFEGDINSDGHILGLQMMHTYIASYWYHQHAQLPILHRPTFSADRTPTLLLLAVIAIGAATLDKVYGTKLTDSAAEFANFIVWHLRWEIIRDIDYRPPAKLWVLQTLLLVEVYEKMYSTRTLHERAHIHHDSTLTLLRRGSSLIGRSAMEVAAGLSEERNARGSMSGVAAQADPADDSWNRWIATEASRRAVFGAFVLDSIHSTMFGHAAKMVTHEIRLPLPCDEALWSATSVAEVSRVQSSLRTNGIKPILFHEGLKSTLNGQRVRTNSFGRMAIMAGLLSLSWHMTQRDLQFAYIGRQAANSIGGSDKWKSALLRAFDNWKADFDEALAEAAIAAPLSPPAVNGNRSRPTLQPIDDENIFETRTVLHHLAHIAAHVDIVDCQVFAGANRLLSRTVTPKDYSLVRDKIEKWALRASARDSAFYALKFITTVLIPPNAGDDAIDHRIHGHATPILPHAFDNSQRYIARDDFLLNRPWVLYVSALVVWCYGYALEGPIIPTPREEDFATYEQRERDMRLFLDSVAAVRAPDDLEHVTGKNRCLGLLLILKESFASTRWELTHEAAGLLGNAAMKLRGSSGAEETMGRGSAWGKGRGNTNGNTISHDMMDYTSASVSAFNTARP